MAFAFVTIFSIFFAIGTDVSKGNIFEDLNQLQAPSNGTVLEKWHYYERLLQVSTKSLMKEALPLVMQSISKVNISAQCKRDIVTLNSALQNMRTWAFRFVDSSGKTIDGVQYASISSFGSFDECVDTVAINDKDGGDMKEMFRGKYCSIDFKPALPVREGSVSINEVLPELRNISEEGTVVSDMAKKAAVFYLHPLRIGTCVPSGCSKEDINGIASVIGKSFALDVCVENCDVKEALKLSRSQLLVICLYIFTVMLSLIGTITNGYINYKDISVKSKFLEVVMTFSLWKNFKKFVNTEYSEGTLTCINGIRFFSMTWIILAHSYALVNFRMYANLIDLEKHAKNFAFQVVANASLAVETFFTMGGLLVSYIGVRFVKLQHYPFNIKIVLIRRLWRLYPMYIYVILFTFLTPLIGSGPLWDIKYLDGWCTDKWWTNMLFINNVYKANEMCLGHTWYISCDIQLFIVALIVMFVHLKWTKFGLLLSGVIAVVCAVICGVITYILELPPTVVLLKLDEDIILKLCEKLYFPPFAHAPPYFIGYLTGYLLATKPKMKISPLLQFVGWTIAISMNFAIVYGTYPWNSGREPTLLETIMYSTFNRSAWSFGVCWVIACCSTGHGGIVNYILSAKVLVPLSRLTFVTYLIHPFVIWMFSRYIRTQIQLDYFMFVWIFFGHLIVSYSLAFGASMLLEAPMMSLEKVVFQNYTQKLEEQVHLESNSQTPQNGTELKINGAGHKHQTDSEVGIDNPTFVYKF